jgi:hypothetical protein
MGVLSSDGKKAFSYCGRANGNTTSQNKKKGNWNYRYPHYPVTGD